MSTSSLEVSEQPFARSSRRTEVPLVLQERVNTGARAASKISGLSQQLGGKGGVEEVSLATMPCERRSWLESTIIRFEP